VARIALFECGVLSENIALLSYTKALSVEPVREYNQQTKRVDA